ncbi:MAG: hypothetical protein R3195_19175 [Gemmatimonadota bacterium]|nr:hypothetical protein [Gemmatimonadota bacterium]
MRILREGEREEALCPTCETWRPTVYRYRTVRLEESGLDVEGVLVGVCDACGETVSLPPQSTPRLREARAPKEHVLEARIPRHLDDVVFVISEKLGAPTAALRGAIVRYYLDEVRRKATTARRVERLARSELAGGACDTRISVRVDRSAWDDVWAVARDAGVRSQSDLIRGALVAAKEDLLDERAKARRRDLERLAAAI